MSPEHKAALAAGRNEGRAVRNYLDALEAHKPKRGRKRTPDTVKRQLADIESRLASASAINRLELTQQKMDLEAELNAKAEADNLDELESAFIKAAKPYAERKGISYAAFRSVGVPAAVLEKAGIARSRG